MIILSMMEVTEQVMARRMLEEANEREKWIVHALHACAIPSIPEKLENLDAGYIYKHASQEIHVGGDFADIFRVGRTQVAFMIGDVSGKWIQSAIQTVIIKYAIRSAALENPKPHQVLKRLNEIICSQFRFDGFASLFYGVLDLNKRTMVCSNGGNEPPVLLRNTEKTATILPVKGRIIGLEKDAEYDEVTIQLAPGDILLLFTNGLTKARSNKRRFYGITEPVQILESKRDAPVQEVLDSIRKKVTEFTDNQLHDDLVMLGLKIK